MEHPTKMSSTSVAGKKHRKTAVWLDVMTDNKLTEALAHYEKMTGRSVSSSLVMRRAIGSLVDHLRSIEGSPQREAEIAALSLTR